MLIFEDEEEVNTNTEFTEPKTAKGIINYLSIDGK
jgi:hypothetical protein